MFAAKKFFITSAALALVSKAASNSTTTTSSSSTSIPSSCTVTATATAQSDLDSLSSCKTISGTLALSGSLVNPSLSGVETIKGGLSIDNSDDIVSFTADSLKEITGDMVMQNLTSIQTVSLSSLTSVSSVSLVALPVLDSFIITALDSADNIVISDTSLTSLDGFNNLEEVSVFNINNNGDLVTIDSPIKTISNGLSISSNGDDLELIFNNLEWANNVTILGAGSVEFNALTKINQSIGFINNTFTSLNMDNITAIGVTLNVVSNDDLTELSFSSLKTLGGALVVANNTKLTNITGFPELTTIGGALDVIGDFTEFTLPKLTSIKGGADIETTKSNFSCDAFNALEKKGKIEGDKYVCKAGTSSTTASLTSGTATSGSSTLATSASYTSSSSSSSNSSSTTTTKSKNAAAGSDNLRNGGLFGGLVAVAVALL
mgnify:CR=1 FL=1